MTVLMTEVKNISAEVMGDNIGSPVGQTSENREQSVIEQIQPTNTEDREGFGERRHYGGWNNESSNSRVRRLDFPIVSDEDPDG